LTSGQASLPRYRSATRYRTFAIATNRRPTRDRITPGSAAVGHPADLATAVAFLASHGKSRQFFPSYELSDFEGTDAPLTGLGRRDLFVNTDSVGRLRGVMGLWDQRSFRQTIVSGYTGSLARLRPLYNLTSAVHRRPHLPPPGHALDYAYVATTAVENDDPGVFDALLDTVIADARSRGLPIVLFGCDDRDPLRPLVERRSFLTYTTRVYVVSWDDDTQPGEPAHDRSLPIYLELGCL
ncbi:MAG: hypothetical protein OEV40_18025, partial [Acidimicrobiia bacterium]|nr:hypothetical protein [Acidimicrobiia bacterium]